WRWTMNDPIRVLIADDHPLFRDGVAHSLSGKANITVIAQAESSEEALRLARELLPDVVLLDIAMPVKGGLAIASEIAVACPATKIIMLTVSEHEDDLLSAFKAGAQGYVLKGVSARELANIINAVAEGEVYVTPALAAGMLVEMTRGRPHDPLMELTEREREILQFVAKGLTNRQIGDHLHLAEKTIKHYMTNILGKLHVRSRLDAALIIARRG
ncbi:MAG: response regulator transcription factor, partial [Anaerolineales bacterium]|nr:response regulator transcription factor [Anaerolineales bacterium]